MNFVVKKVHNAGDFLWWKKVQNVDEFDDGQSIHPNQLKMYYERQMWWASQVKFYDSSLQRHQFKRREFQAH